MMLVLFFGSLAVLAGVIYLGVAAVWNGPLSRTRRSAAAADTLEPRRDGSTVFDLSQNWPGLALALVGGLLMLAGAAL
jgi:hypothetical protein